jgi:type VI secretion system FHA domain protein
MNLTLEVVSQNGQSLGASRRKVFGPEGGRIGRAPDCDWVLANPYVSRHHATVRWISGRYYIESTGENGVAINSPQAMLPRLERRALNPGDRVFIDEYEVVVGLGVGAAQPAPPLSAGATPSALIPDEDPFAPPAPVGRSSAALVDPLELAAEELDPMKRLFGGSAPRPGPVPAPVPSWNHTPGVSDHYSPPPVPAQGPVIPDNWDQTTFGAQQRGSAATPVTGSTSGAPPVVIPDDWNQTSFSRGRVPGPAAPIVPQPAGPTPQVRSVNGGPPPAIPQRLQPDRSGTRPIPRAPAPPQRALPPTPQPVAAPETQSRPDGLDVTALLRAAGVDPATVPPETAASLGLILRSVTQGVVEVLQSRAEIKNQFRMAFTRVKIDQNNPLKFAVNADDALNSLLTRRNPAWLGPVDAFEDAFDDIRHHQMAMLAGMRAGFEHVLSRFEPERLQELFDKRGKRGGVLAMSGKARYWEMYAEEFHERMGDRDEAFRRLFGESFANAYEQQLEALKLGGHEPHR